MEAFVDAGGSALVRRVFVHGSTWVGRGEGVCNTFGAFPLGARVPKRHTSASRSHVRCAANEDYDNKQIVEVIDGLEPLPAGIVSVDVIKHETKSVPNQKTGTSGLRRKTRDVIDTPNFVENWVQALFDALGGPFAVAGKTLIVGGDGRYYNRTAAQTIIRVAAANGILCVVIGKGGLLTTPAVSSLIRKYDALGGIIMTASHNPGGLDADWGVKYNTESGGPALERLTDQIYKRTCSIEEYVTADLGIVVNLDRLGAKVFANGTFTVDVIDPVDDYCELLETVFDFDAIRGLLKRTDFSMLFDAMHASTGDYARRIFVDELGATPDSILNGVPLEDFGGGHPDPNLTYAAELVSRLDPSQNPNAREFGAASDGDGDRNMILGKGVFVNPGDSVAIIAAYAKEAIPYFAKRGVVGLARSMPTSSALDRVAKDLGVPLYETPTGWKYFTNLMDDGMLSICGEESFGTSSDHMREKDGIWAVLAWLSILAYVNKDTKDGELVGVGDILLKHWRKYGRTYTMRHDYEAVSGQAGNAVMKHVRSAISDESLRPPQVVNVDEFEYKDPVDSSVAKQQGVRVFTKDGARIVYRLSGTGSAGATIRVYFEQHEDPHDGSDFAMREPQQVFSELAKLSREFARIPELTGRDAPTVIT